ncbi:MAG: universal stress protein [Deltaproteobacteria bacterium]|jgi:nucleotide-binding universal stress UspA family protein|nr:universal stress protein [Deltaproteobacteria bacterium]
MQALAIKKILCAVDFSQQSELVARHAVAIAKPFSAALEFLYVCPTLSELGGHHEVDPKKLRSLEEDIFAGSAGSMDRFIREQAAGTEATGKVLLGNPAELIVQRAKETGADLIVIGTHGRTGVEHMFFGSVAEKVVRGATVPVLVTRGQA